MRRMPRTLSKTWTEPSWKAVVSKSRLASVEVVKAVTDDAPLPNTVDARLAPAAEAVRLALGAEAAPTAHGGTDAGRRVRDGTGGDRRAAVTAAVGVPPRRRIRRRKRRRLPGALPEDAARTTGASPAPAPPRGTQRRAGAGPAPPPLRRRRAPLHPLTKLRTSPLINRLLLAGHSKE